MINFGIDPDSRVSVVPASTPRCRSSRRRLGLAMLDRFDDTLARRRATAGRLRALMARHPLTYQAGCDESTWQVFQLLMPDGATRERAVTLADVHRIEIRTMFEPPLHRHPAFARAPAGGTLAVTEAVARRTLSLPMANTLGPRQLARLTAFIDAALAGPDAELADPVCVRRRRARPR